MLVHLRMSGDLLLGRDANQLGKYSRFRLLFEDGLQMSFNDARKFGRIWLLKDPQMLFEKLGPEPLNESLTSDIFYELIHSRKRQLKSMLLDQSFLAGVGNIYADEALHAAKLHPLTVANKLTRKESDRLLKSIRSVLNEAIIQNGSSIDWAYQGGGFQNYFRVYQKTGEPCHRCATKIERLVVGQRGTHICPSCQSIKS
jgi:formamidopyrimidine-DNA glycosylase